MAKLLIGLTAIHCDSLSCLCACVRACMCGAPCESTWRGKSRSQAPWIRAGRRAQGSSLAGRCKRKAEGCLQEVFGGKVSLRNEPEAMARERLKPRVQEALGAQGRVCCTLMLALTQQPSHLCSASALACVRACAFVRACMCGLEGGAAAALIL
jgi:hypothetical protein